MATLQRIMLYPVKSLDGVEVDSARVLPEGALEHDRRWRLVDTEGRVVNAKRTAAIHRIRVEYDLGDESVRLSLRDAAESRSERFPLVPGGTGPCGWLSEAIHVEVRLEERRDGGFPDDREAPGPTIISTASLAEVAGWFSLDLAESRRRFRTNLEIEGCDAFWEDTLASPSPAEPAEFSIGEVKFRGTNVCRRCVVPSRDSRTGDVAAAFREAFEARRSRGLRPDVDAADWHGFYRLAVNTTLSSEGGTLAVGQPVTSYRERK
jgi:uncharacterized protein YcbX